MSRMDDWLTTFLTDVDSLSTPRMMDRCVELFEEFGKFEDKTYSNVDQLKEVCARLDMFLSSRKPTPDPGKIKSLVFDAFFARLLEFLMELSRASEETHAYLRDETNLLSTLTFFLSCKYQLTDKNRMLKAIEVLSRNIVVKCTSPYLSTLTREVFFTAFLDDKVRADTGLYCLRIMTNLVFENETCLSMVFRDNNYRALHKKILEWLFDTDCVANGLSHEVQVMALLCCLLTDKSITISVENQIQHIARTFTEIQDRIKRKDYNPIETASTIFYVSKLVRTMCTRYSLECPTSSQELSQAAEKTSLKKIVDEVSSIVFKFFPKVFPMLRTESGQVVLDSLFQLMKALCPEDVSAKEYDNLWVSISKSLNELSILSSPKSKSQVIVLETHIYFLDRILGKEGRKVSVSAESFNYAMNNCGIVVSTTPIDFTRNILSIRLLNRLYALASSQNRKESTDQVVAKINKVLADPSVEKLLKDLIFEDANSTSDAGTPCFEMSNCVVELLNIISKHSKGPSRLIEYLEQEKAWFHIANCIVNGNCELVVQALSVMSAVGFTAKARAGVSRTLIEMRSASKSIPPSPERPKLFTFQAQMGIKKLNDHLEMFECARTPDMNPPVEDLLAWFKLRAEMQEAEMASTNEHVFQLNKTVAHLKILLNKQANLDIYKAGQMEAKNRELGYLRSQLEMGNEKKFELQRKHYKAIESIRSQLQVQEDNVKVKAARLAQLEDEVVRLKSCFEDLTKNKAETDKVLSTLENEKKQLQKRLDGYEKEVKSAKAKIATLEGDLKKSEEGRRTAETLLDQERRKTEIIQQVLGRGNM